MPDISSVDAKDTKVKIEEFSSVDKIVTQVDNQVSSVDTVIKREEKHFSSVDESFSSVDSQMVKEDIQVFSSVDDQLMQDQMQDFSSVDVKSIKEEMQAFLAESDLSQREEQAFSSVDAKLTQQKDFSSVDSKLVSDEQFLFSSVDTRFDIHDKQVSPEAKHQDLGASPKDKGAISPGIEKTSPGATSKEFEVTRKETTFHKKSPDDKYQTKPKDDFGKDFLDKDEKYTEISRYEEQIIADSPEKLQRSIDSFSMERNVERHAESMSDESLVEVQLDALKKDIKDKVYQENEQRSMAAARSLRAHEDLSDEELDEESDEIFDQKPREKFSPFESSTSKLQSYQKPQDDRTEVTYEFPVQEELSSDEDDHSKESSLETFLSHEKICEEEEKEILQKGEKVKDIISPEYGASSITRDRQQVTASSIYRVEDEQDMTADEESSEEMVIPGAIKPGLDKELAESLDKGKSKISSVKSEQDTYFEIGRQEEQLRVSSPEKLERSSTSIPAMSDGLSTEADHFLVSRALAHETSSEKKDSERKSPVHVAKDDDAIRFTDKISSLKTTDDKAAVHLLKDLSAEKMKGVSAEDFREEEYLSSDESEAEDEDYDKTMEEMDYMSKSKGFQEIDETQKEQSFGLERQTLKEELFAKEKLDRKYVKESVSREANILEESIEDFDRPGKFISEQKSVEDVKVKISEKAISKESQSSSTTVDNQTTSVADSVVSMKEKEVESETKREKVAKEDEFEKQTSEEIMTKDAIKMHLEQTEGTTITQDTEGTKKQVSQEKSSIHDHLVDETTTKSHLAKEMKDDSGKAQTFDNLDKSTFQKDSVREISTEKTRAEDQFKTEEKEKVAMKDKSQMSMEMSSDLTEIDAVSSEGMETIHRRHDVKSAEMADKFEHEDGYEKERTKLKSAETAKVLEVIESDRQEAEDSGDESDHSFIEHTDEEIEALSRSGRFLQRTMEDLIEEGEEQFVDRREHFEYHKSAVYDAAIDSKPPKTSRDEHWDEYEPSRGKRPDDETTKPDDKTTPKDQMSFLGKQETVKEKTNKVTTTIAEEKSDVRQSTKLFRTESLEEPHQTSDSHPEIVTKDAATHEKTFDSDFSSYHREGSSLGTRGILVPSSSTEAQERSATPSASDDESSGEYYSGDLKRKVKSTEMIDSVEYPLRDKLSGISERPLSPTEYTLMTESQLELHEAFEAAIETQGIMSQSMIESQDSMTSSQMELMSQSMIGEELQRSLDSQSDIEGRISVDTSQQIFIEQCIEARKDHVLSPGEMYAATELKPDDERPPSPSEFTLLTSLEQEELAKALGIQETSLKPVEIPEEYQPTGADSAEAYPKSTERFARSTRLSEESHQFDVEMKGIS